MTIAGLRLERRLSVTRRSRALSLLAALSAAFGISSLLIASAGANVLEALAAFLQGAYGSRAALVETLVQATPLIFTGLAVVLAFRAGVWNIGAEGQFFAGAIGTIWVARVLPNLHPVTMLIAIVIGSAVAGAISGLVAGVLKARYQANEVVVTVMLNFVIVFGASYLLGGVWRDPSSAYLQTARIPSHAFFPRILPSGRLHAGFLLALLAAGAVYVLLTKTILGYELRAVGSNPRAAQFKGIDIRLTIVIAMAVSGALAGMGGGSEVAGLHHRLRLDVSTGYGFTGIIVALLSRLHPIATVGVAILLGGLVNGATSMHIATGVPVALVLAIQGLTLIFALSADVVSRFRISRFDAHA